MKVLTDSEYQQLRAVVKALGFATVSMNTRQYDRGSVNIIPLKKSGKWSKEQFAAIRQVVADAGLLPRPQDVWDSEQAHHVFGCGVRFLFKVDS